MEERPALGIDIAKEKFDTRIKVNGKEKKKRFDNTPSGQVKLSEWLTHLGVAQVHACLEATGTYGEALAEYLYAAGHTVSVVNPARIKGYAQSQMKRHKTDDLDAEIIRHFCETQHPPAWQPTAPEIKALQAMVRRLDDLIQLRTQEHNRQQSGVTSPIVQASIEHMLQHIDQEITQLQQQIDDHVDQHPDLTHQVELITSIPGLGARTAIKLIAEFKAIAGYTSARSLAASVGVTPAHRQSGTSLHAHPKISKIGNAALRGALWWPAVSAMKHNPIIIDLVKRLRKAGLHNFAIIVAVIHKLLHLVYGVIKNDAPFDPDWHPKLLDVQHGI